MGEEQFEIGNGRCLGLQSIILNFKSKRAGVSPARLLRLLFRMKRDSFDCMWIRAAVAFLFLGFACLEAGQRAQSWKLEALPGAYRLSLENIQGLELPEGAGDSLRSAALDLIEVSGALGQQLRLIEGHGHPKGSIILELADVHGLQSDEAFVIHRERTRVYLRATSEQGLLNGLYAIAQQWYGARWYWPSALGLEIVHPPIAKVPERRWTDAPAFVHRRLYPSNTDFGRRNRLVRQYSFNHNLAKVFDAELFEIEPEVFPVIQGKRIQPQCSAGTDPQPELTHPRTIEIAAEAAMAHFKENPESQSFSLSINDNVSFDESSWTELVVSPVQYFRQRPDYTNLVFGFMNAVAERVFDEAGLWETPTGKPRYLTALAYYWTEQSPVISVHPRVMPVLTSDRAQWHDPDYRAEDKALIERWANSGAERIATWDYYFGAPYPYPRQFNAWMAESLQYLNEQGVDVLFSQLPSAWGLDGAKAWLATQLLWDPAQDSNALLDEYYSNFFGPAAEPMRQFYELPEQHRNQFEGKADWIKFYLDEAGIELVLPILKELRECIQTANTCVAAESRYAERIQVVSDAFLYTEKYAAYYEGRLALLKACLSGGADEKDIAVFLEARSAYLSYAENLYADPMHQRLKSFERLVQSDPVSLALQYLQDAPAEANYRLLWEVARDYEQLGGQPLLANTDLVHADERWQKQSFLGPALPQVDEWHFNFRPYQHFKIEACSEGKGLRISGADMCSVFTNIEVEAGHAYVFSFEVDYRISPDNRSNLVVHWYNEDWEKIEAMLPLQLPNGHSLEPIRAQLPLIAPEGAAHLRLSFTVSRQYEGDYLELHAVGLDKVNRP